MSANDDPLDAYRLFRQHEQELERIERESGIYTIDIHRADPGIRHKAIKTGDGDWMKTMCGHKIINYFHAGLTSRYYVDGKVYVNLCRICFQLKEEERHDERE